MRLAEISGDGVDHGVPDLVEVIHLGARLLVGVGDLQTGLVESIPRSVAARERPRRGLADLAHAERVDEALERNLAASLDGIEEIAHRGFAVTFLLLELDLRVARGKREDVGGLLEPALLVEEDDLLFAETIDVEGAARHEMLEVLDLLMRARELAAAIGACPLLASRDGLAHDRRVQRARTVPGKLVGLGVLRPLLREHAQHLGDHVAGALDRHGVVDAHIEPLDLVLVVERGVRDHDAADRHRLEPRNRRERAGAADLDVDGVYDGGRLLGRELVRDRPARIARNEAEPLLPVEPVDLVDHAVDIVIERRAPLLDLAMEGDEFLDAAARLDQRIDHEACVTEPREHVRLGLGRHAGHLAPGIGEEMQRP